MAIPVSELLQGHETEPLPDECIVVGASMLLKVLDADGKQVWYVRNTAAFSSVETIGALHAQLTRLTADFLSGWEEEEDA